MDRRHREIKDAVQIVLKILYFTSAALHLCYLPIYDEVHIFNWSMVNHLVESDVLITSHDSTHQKMAVVGKYQIPLI